MSLDVFRTELSDELDRILNYWSERLPDRHRGGFVGRIDFKDIAHSDAEKGAVMHARILWTFSAAWHARPSERTKEMATRAFDYLRLHFIDAEYGGVYWSVDASGHPKDTKKQIYAVAFALYGFSEYYAAFADETALALARQLWHDIEKYSRDPRYDGYLEAFSRNWTAIDDLRLSEKDANEKKTMNTHLHIVEAYANLYRIWPDERLKNDIASLLWTIERHFIDKETGHLRLFFDEKWTECKDVISFGHDIEAAWLLLECAEAIKDPELIMLYGSNCLLMADAVKDGIDSDGGLWYEYDPAEDRLIAEKHWWPQAELLLGYHKAWEISGEAEYHDILIRNWEFIKKYMRDSVNGEWIWGINADYTIMEKDKAGFWKCPYHNGRACLYLMQH